MVAGRRTVEKVRSIAPTSRWVTRALVALALLVAIVGMLVMNIRLDRQAHDLDQPMPCSSDNDIVCRFGFVR